MLSHTFRFPVAVALVATVVAVGVIVLVLLALGQSQAGTSQAGGATDGAMAVDCDASQGGIQSACTYAPGSSFNIQIHITQPPAGGYNTRQAKVEWTEGVVNYLPTADPGDEALGPNCTIPARVNNWEGLSMPSVLFACVPFPAPDPLLTDTGAFLTFEFQCKGTPVALSPPAGLESNQALLRLVPRPGDPQQGSHFTDLSNAAIEPGPALTNATVTCGVPTPTPTPTATDTATPTPTDIATPTATPPVVFNPCLPIGAGTSAAKAHDISLDVLRGASKIRGAQAKRYTAVVKNHNLTGAENIQLCFTVVPLFGCPAPVIDVALPYDVTPREPDNVFVDVTGDGVLDSVAGAVAPGVLPNRSARIRVTVIYSSCPPAAGLQETPFDYIVQVDACHQGDAAPKGFFGGACLGSNDAGQDPNQSNDAPIQKAVNDALR